MDLILVALAFLFQAAAPQAASGSIEGMVIKAGVGEPLSRVTVGLLGMRDPVTITTAADGKFSFPDLGPGRYLLSGTLPGYVFTELSSPLVLAPGERMAGIRLAMLQTGAISGRVLDRNGEPASRAQVQAQRLVYRDGIPSLTTVQAVLTNDLGEYRLFWLPPSQYIVGAVLSDPNLAALPVIISPSTVYSPSSTDNLHDTLTLRSGTNFPGILVTSRPGVAGTSIEEASVPAYYPGTLDAQSASRIDVRPGSNIGGIDFTAARTRVFRVRGTVIDETTGRSVRPNSIALAPRSIANSFQDRGPGAITADGFEFSGVAPGSYFLTATYLSPPPDLNPLTAQMKARVAIEVSDASLVNVPIVVRRPFIVSGRMSFEGQRSLLNPPTIPGGQSLPAAQVVLRDDQGGGLSVMSIPVTADGLFSLPVFRGAYEVFVRNIGGFSGYVKSIRLGPEDGLYDRIHLDGPTQSTLEVVIGTNPANLTGTVLNERRQPYQNVTVVLVPEPRLRSRPGLFMVEATDSSGRFSIQGIAPGNYKMFAWEGVESGMWFDPEFMRIQETRGRPVSFVEGGAENVELTGIPVR